ncbi:MAG TPA: AMP-binding protein [Oligoflexus sp.]|uniref:AMP-binding protein n=1 Tax=Oligoflexus sp. TaxID=1971216 RepID=UPI002D7EA1FA|nr:AMP-binding protein [Oligoflexus sp.]HET9239989.1 AMP-binding protein [Oligoflexus sp.]
MKTSLHNIFKQHAAQPAWRTPEGSLTYQDLEQRVRRHATLLMKSGAKAGDFWAVRGWSALDTFALLLAALWQRVTLFPLPDRLPDAQHQIMMQQVPLAGVLESAAPKAEMEKEGPIDCDADAPAVGIFTSGSTGAPKAIIHSWNSLTSSAEATNSFYGLKPGDSWLLSLDPAHIGGLQIAVRCFIGGGITWHLAEPKALAHVLHTKSPTFLSLVPTQLYRLLSDPLACDALRLSRAIVLGGAAASPELLQEAAKKSLPFSVSYGSSETAAQCTALPPGVLPRHAGDVGYLLSGWEYQHSAVTLRLRGPAAASGVYQQKEWRSLVDADGWLTLPDRILCDAGRLTILGRADGIFQVAGENVSPLDIIQPLEALRQHADFLALPWQDVEYGTIPVLIVRSPEKPDIPAILQRLQTALNGVQRPRRIYWHASDEISKPSRSYYEKALERHELPLVWRLDLGRI